MKIFSEGNLALGIAFVTTPQDPPHCRHKIPHIDATRSPTCHKFLVTKLPTKIDWRHHNQAIIMKYLIICKMLNVNN